MAIFYTDTGSLGQLEISGSGNILNIKGSGSNILIVSGSAGSLLEISDLSPSANVFTVSSGSIDVFTIGNSKNVSISGSLIVTGSITGSLLGTASFATTASFALNAGGGSSTINIQDEGVAQGSVSTINFTGAGVTASVAGDTATVNIPGGGGGGGSVPGQIILTAAGSWPSITNGAAAPIQAQTTTNTVNFYYVEFADAVTSHTNWAIAMPSDYDGGTVTATFYWISPSSSTNSVVWGMSGRAFGNGDALDAAFGTVQTVTDANNGADVMNISATTSAITLAGTPAAGEYVQFKAERQGGDGGDTLAAVAELLQVRITYTRA